jgi:antitoxin (DNA-binding transcriptional repressor) of toxin-antitoxin stability system
MPRRAARLARTRGHTCPRSRIDVVATRSYIARMHSVGIKSLKDKLSEYIRLAASGETVLVTDRGRVVAEIIRPRTTAVAMTVEQRMAELERLGLVTPVLHKLSSAPHIPADQLADYVPGSILKDLDADREDR